MDMDTSTPTTHDLMSVPVVQFIRLETIEVAASQTGIYQIAQSSQSWPEVLLEQ
jgi:hypothetical protein